MGLFSQTEVPSLCLQDSVRTSAFIKAIELAIRPGDIVVDAGSGSGILALVAARAGARKIYAVEANEILCHLLKSNAAKNGYANTIEVVHGDIREVDLPQRVDVVIAEMIETWLLDEQQLPAIEALHKKNVIAAHTRIIPESYEAHIEFGNLPFEFYGFQLPFPLHYWPDQKTEKSWVPLDYCELTEPIKVFPVDFRIKNSSKFEAKIRVVGKTDGVINAARLSGIAHLFGSEFLNDTVTFNGDKLIPVSPTNIRKGEFLEVNIQGNRGSEFGLLDFKLSFDEQK